MNLFKIVSKSLIFGSHLAGIFENWQTNLNIFVSASRHELRLLGGLLHVLLIINRWPVHQVFKYCLKENFTCTYIYIFMQTEKKQF